MPLIFVAGTRQIVNVIYYKVGQYSEQLSAKNVVGTLNCSYNITVANPISQSAFIIGNSSLMTRNPPGPGALFLVLVYTDIPDNFPPFVTVRTLWGSDERSPTPNITITLASMPLKISPPSDFFVNGYNKATFQVIGPVNNFKIVTTIGSFVPLSQVETQIRYGAALAVGFGPDANQFPAGTTITLSLSAPSLSNLGPKPRYCTATFKLTQQSSSTLISLVVTNTSSAQLILPAEGFYNIFMKLATPFETVINNIIVQATSSIRGLQVTYI